MTRRSGMPGMADMMMEPAAWTLGYAGLMFAMWWVMMAAMMLPSAAPILLLFARVNRAEKAGNRPFVASGIFAAGYLAAWGGFSALATGLQWELEQLGLLSPMMVTTSYWLGGAILIAVGVWQLTPVKGVCLRHCRSPLSFLTQGWRHGRTRRLSHGDRARHLLPGLLLVPDGPLVLRRHHEPVLDCRLGCLHPVRKNDSNGPLVWTNCRHRCRCLGCGDARKRSGRLVTRRALARTVSFEVAASRSIEVPLEMIARRHKNGGVLSAVNPLTGWRPPGRRRSRSHIISASPRNGSTAPRSAAARL